MHVQENESMMKLSTSRRRRSGFTLLELLLVIAILLVLGGVSVGVYIQIQKSSEKKAAQLLVNDVTNIVKRYHQEVALPGEAGLGDLVTRPDDERLGARWDEGAPYFEGGKIPTDPWGTELGFVLESDDEKAKQTGIYFHVYSFGPDKTDDNGTGDDIPTWAEESDQ